MGSAQVVYQIQALTTSIEELIQQNLELRHIVVAQSGHRNEERQENNNGKDTVNLLNHRRRGTLERENSYKMEEELHDIRKKIHELRSAMKEKSVVNLDGMIKMKVLNCPLPPKFQLPQLESFGGLKDPLDHIEAFKTHMHLQMTPNEVMCRAFLTVLKGATKVWFSKFPPGTIGNLEQLGESFVRHFIGDNAIRDRPSTEHPTGRRRVTKAICRSLQHVGVAG